MWPSIRILGMSVAALAACSRPNPGFIPGDDDGGTENTSAATSASSDASVTMGPGSGTSTTTMSSDGMTGSSTDPASSTSGGTGFDGECAGQSLPTALDITLSKNDVKIAEKPCNTSVVVKIASVASVSANDVVLHACDGTCAPNCVGDKYTLQLYLAGADAYFPKVEVGDCVTMTAHYATLRDEAQCPLSQIGLARVMGNISDPAPLFFASTRMTDPVKVPELTALSATPSVSGVLPTYCECGKCCAKNKYRPGDYSLDVVVKMNLIPWGFPVSTEDLNNDIGNYAGTKWEIDVKVVQAVVTGTCLEEPHVQWVAHAHPAD